jgi:hypothetical protein
MSMLPRAGLARNGAGISSRWRDTLPPGGEFRGLRPVQLHQAGSLATAMTAPWRRQGGPGQRLLNRVKQEFVGAVDLPALMAGPSGGHDVHRQLDVALGVKIETDDSHWR